MKCGIVPSSVVAKTKRMDAGYYLGQVGRAQDALARAEKQLVKAKTRVENARRSLIEAQQQAAALAAAGDVVPWP